MFLSLDGGSVHPPRTRQKKHLTKQTHTHTQKTTPHARSVSYMHVPWHRPALEVISRPLILTLFFFFMFCFVYSICCVNSRHGGGPKSLGWQSIYLFPQLSPTLILIHIHILTYVFVFVQGGQFTAPGAPWAGRYSTTNTNVIRCSSRRVS